MQLLEEKILLLEEKNTLLEDRIIVLEEQHEDEEEEEEDEEQHEEEVDEDEEEEEEDEEQHEEEVDEEEDDEEEEDEDEEGEEVEEDDVVKEDFDKNGFCNYCGWCSSFQESHVMCRSECKYVLSKYILWINKHGELKSKLRIPSSVRYNEKVHTWEDGTQYITWNDVYDSEDDS